VSLARPHGQQLDGAMTRRLVRRFDRHEVRTMSDDNKKWYRVEGYSEVFFSFNVKASSEEEAEQLFWKSDVQVHETRCHVEVLDIEKVTECEQSQVTHDLTRRLTGRNPSTRTVGDSAHEPSS
jgi:hypothetical protein